MKNLYFFYIIFLTIFIVSCEKEPFHSTEENVPETINLQINFNGESELIIDGGLPPLSKNDYSVTKNSHNNSNYRLYNSLEELENACSDLNRTSSLSAVSGIAYSGYNTTFFGGYIEVVNGEELVTIRILNDSYILIYQEQFVISSPIFFGIATEEPMGNIAIFKNQNNPNTLIKSTNVYVGNCDFITDSDGDGVPDDEDLMPNSNMEETVIIEECDSSVENIALGEGYMLSDKIDELEAGEYKNHGHFVKATAHYLILLVKEGILTNEEKDLIMECAGSSSI